MTTSDPNPGSSILGVGIICVICQAIGVVTGAPLDASTPPAAIIGLAITLGLTVFIASVVGAYCAGRKKR